LSRENYPLFERKMNPKIKGVQGLIPHPSTNCRHSLQAVFLYPCHAAS
jgi:hypothetical protein